MHRAMHVRAIERKCRNCDIELFSLRIDHAVAANHKSRRCLQRCTGGIFELFAGVQRRLFAHDTITAHYLFLAIGIRDLPESGEQLYLLSPQVLDHDGVCPEVMPALRVRLVFQILWLHRNLDVPSFAAIHPVTIVCGAKILQSLASDLPLEWFSTAEGFRLKPGAELGIVRQSEAIESKFI